ncbi:MAG TPA: hypothetical protein V6D18_11185 [Thermosynechococcaceae cyanobacterium]
MTQPNDLSQRIDRTEGQVIDLQMTANLILQAIDKNSTDIAALLEISRRNSELGRRNSEGISALQDGTAALQLSQLRTEAALQVFQQHTDAAIERLDAVIERLTASDERTEQLLEYLIRRNQGQPD